MKLKHEIVTVLLLCLAIWAASKYDSYHLKTTKRVHYRTGVGGQSLQDFWITNDEEVTYVQWRTNIVMGAGFVITQQIMKARMEDVWRWGK